MHMVAMNLRFLPKNFEPLTLSIPGNNGKVDEEENDVNEGITGRNNYFLLPKRRSLFLQYTS
jgi:hypothetical protein